MKKKKVWLIVLIVVLVLILALAIGGFAVVKSYLGQIGRVGDTVTDTIAPEDEFFEVDETPAVSQTPAVEPTDEPTDDPDKPSAEPTGEPTTTPEDPAEEVIAIDPADVEWGFIERIEDDHLINILLVGQDCRKGQGRQRSDSMILCSINPDTGEVSLISFLRDLYVQIPGGYSDNRLNTPYVFGGFDLLDQTLTANFGISIDANFEVDFTGFEAIINMVGGIDIYLTAQEAEYARRVWNEFAEEGINHFDGNYALAYARIRKLDSDFGRTNRQKEVLLAVFDKVKGLHVNELLALMYDALPYVTTDLTDTEILSLAYRLLPLVSSLKIGTYTVPSSNAYTRAFVNGMDVLVPNRERIRDQLANEYLPLN